MSGPSVLIVMGSESDLLVMREAAEILSKLGVSHSLKIASAHRTPDKLAALSRYAREKGVKVFIAGAGCAAHLAGAIAANTTLPVIGVPLEASPLAGFDALLSTVQMPAGLPVATVAIGKAGVRNAAILAAQIISLSDKSLAKKLERERIKMAKKVEEADKRLKQ